MPRSRHSGRDRSRFLACLSGFWRCVPHLLLNLPLAVRLSMQHQRHLPVALNHRLSLRRLHHLMLRRPLRSPFPAHVNIVELHLLLHYFVPRDLRHDVFHPCRDFLSPDHRRVSRHQIHSVLRPQHQNPRRIHFFVQLHVTPVKRLNLFSPGVLRRTSFHSCHRQKRRCATRSYSYFPFEFHPVPLDNLIKPAHSIETPPSLKAQSETSLAQPLFGGI